MHSSVKLETPCEFINVTPLNPLISKCQIKVCYVGDEPNRNRSVITKDVAREMANSLPGSPIVGHFNESTGDFEEHNKFITLEDGQIVFKDDTRPYGFVDLGAKVWFQKFLDDGVNEREYLMTEGYIWTGQYPEAQRIIDKGNNQSMELDNDLIDAFWTKDSKGKPQFFIINEAIFSKLCILGEDHEPCFEGANISKVQYSFEDDFKQKLFSLIEDMKEMLDKGGTPVFNTYAVEIGDALWQSLYNFLETKYPRLDEEGRPYSTVFCLEGIYEEEFQKFAILRNRDNNKYFRLNFSISEGTGFMAADTLIEVEKTYAPVGQFALEDIEKYEAERAEVEPEVETQEEPIVEEPVIEEEPEVTEEPEIEVDSEPEEGEGEESPENEDKNLSYNLDEIQEYTELVNKYSALEKSFEEISNAKAALETENAELVAFKKGIERKEKEAMINSFYMLSDTEKKDVVDNIDTYSLDDIEAKLSIICVRNKVNFNLDDDNNSEEGPTTFSLDGNFGDENVPAWVKSLRDVAKTID